VSGSRPGGVSDLKSKVMSIVSLVGTFRRYRPTDRERSPPWLTSLLRETVIIRSRSFGTRHHPDPHSPTPENERLRSVLLLDTGLVQDDRLNWPKWVTEALGAQRTEALAQLSGRVTNLQAMAVDQSTLDVVLVPLKGQAAKKWEMLGLKRREDWVFIASADGTTTLAMDEPSEDGMRDPAAAVIYPELHTRLVSWWLVHAWRGCDLLEDTLENLRRWRITSGAVTGRAVVEEAGSLVDEAARLAEAWKVSKAIPADKFKRPEAVRRELEPILLHAGFGSRLKISHKQLQATSVLTTTPSAATTAPGTCAKCRTCSPARFAARRPNSTRPGS